ncbi:60S ribosomal protein L21-2 [Camellia lanceoleosa]|uniref:60S ribosomal protein L21-2 n=1 Tax=Camellia lanceoleosa TaxID=1840588 RepID=A0ACC0IS96_9ERIC|nr:60S ribosomal protein L21-2 [Camellia lanceoleosa]
MPHKFYHGRTGQVWNVTKRAIGVEMNKQVGNRIIRKRIHVRIEHVQPSRCTEDFKLRKKKNDRLKAEAKARGEVISTKRQPEGPKPGFMVEGYNVLSDVIFAVSCGRGINCPHPTMICRIISLSVDLDVLARSLRSFFQNDLCHLLLLM